MRALSRELACNVSHLGQQEWLVDERLEADVIVDVGVLPHRVEALQRLAGVLLDDGDANLESGDANLEPLVDKSVKETW